LRKSAWEGRTGKKCDEKEKSHNNNNNNHNNNHNTKDMPASKQVF